MQVLVCTVKSYLRSIGQIFHDQPLPDPVDDLGAPKEIATEVAESGDPGRKAGAVLFGHAAQRERPDGGDGDEERVATHSGKGLSEARHLGSDPPSLASACPVVPRAQRCALPREHRGAGRDRAIREHRGSSQDGRTRCGEAPGWMELD